MKVCITSEGNQLTSNVDPRFGRCKYFIFYDSKNQEYEAIENTMASAGSGAGTQSGQLMVNSKIEMLFTGKLGPNALQVLKEAGIKIVSEQSGSIQSIIDSLNSGKYN